jgi:hypothetical protein
MVILGSKNFAVPAFRNSGKKLMRSVLNGFNTVEEDSNVSKLYFLLMQCGIAKEGQEGFCPPPNYPQIFLVKR